MENTPEAFKDRVAQAKARRNRSNEKGKCEAGRVSQYACQRTASAVRVTSNGTRVGLCAKHDAAFGRVVGVSA